MKRVIVALLFLFLLASLALAQTAHSVVLTWTDPNNPASVTYSVYRATGLCSGSPAFSKIATAVTGLTYTDTTVIPGSYCYQVTATLNGAESAPSPTVNPTVPSFPPATLSVTSVK